MSGKPYKFYQVPSIETGYIFNREKSFFSVIVPEESINLLHNPEVANLLTYAGNGVVAALADDQQYVGLNSLTGNMPNNSYLFASILTALTPVETYTFSVSVRSASNHNFEYVLQIINGATNTVVTTSKRFSANTLWERNAFSFVVPVGGIPQPRLAVRRVDGGPTNRRLYVDAWQLERGDYDTTFISGALNGLIPGEVPKPYYWVNTPHYSQSVRLQSTNSGGRVVSLESIGFQVTGFSGFGMPDFDIESSEIASRYNSVYWNSVVKERDIEICGVIVAKSPKDFFTIRSKLVNLFASNLYDKPQPLKFTYQLYDCDKAVCDCIEFTAYYESGLGGDIESIIGEEICISLKMLDITFKSCRDTSVTLDATVVDGANSLVGTSRLGEWKPMYSDLTQYHAANGMGAWDNKPAIEIGPDGNLYVGGNENSFGNVQGEAALKRWNGVSMDNIGFLIRPPGYPGDLYAGNLRHKIYCLLAGPDNKLYIGGTFMGIRNQAGTSVVTILSGPPGPLPAPPANTSMGLNFVRYDILTDTFEYIGKFNNNGFMGPLNSTAAFALDNPSKAAVNDMQILRDGRIILGGLFANPTNSVGVAITDLNAIIYNVELNTFERIATFAPVIGPGAPEGRVLTIAEAKDGDIWFGGSDFLGIANLTAFYQGVTRLSRVTGRLENPCMSQTCGLIGFYTGPGQVYPQGTIYKLLFDKQDDLWACGDFYADTQFADARPPLPFDYNRVTVRDSSTTNAVPSVCFGFAKLVTGAWPGLFGWSSPGIIGTTVLYNPDPLKFPDVARLGRVFDMDIDDNGNIHLVGLFNFASTNLPNPDYLSLPIVNPLDFANTIDQALSTQEPNVTSYVIWDGSKFSIPDISMFDATSPQNLTYMTKVRVGNRFGRRYTQQILNTAIPNFQYVFNDTDNFAVDFNSNVYLYSQIPAEVFVPPFLRWYRPVLNEIDLDCANFARPIIVFRGPGILRSIENKTTGSRIEFNKKFESDEFAVLDLRGDFFSFRSNLEGDIRHTILPNSQLSSFNLVPGKNRIITFFQPDSVSASTKVTFTWRNEYLSIDAGCECEGVENV